MNKYESVIIITDKINKEERDNVLEKVKKYIKNNGEIELINDIGMRKLAYEIRKHKQGYFYSIIFKAKPQKILELERIYRITVEIIKFMTIRNEN